ncbi:hypothetical protein AXF42_Ash021647 [Apostasia shenzhenica]|uniref:Uncharacterized protein n=1 Tax=Apostasia shenzhenica TaxID=1088818 RepID=A0A2H9ZRX5_9ASPA|nr:hypothetical protein AXF42_Ash021647 [Apostasia shenzhenica]
MVSSNNSLLISQLHVVVLLGLCATTATASLPISGENNSGWRSLMNHGDLSPLVVTVAHTGVTLWNSHHSRTTGTVMAYCDVEGIWVKVTENCVTIFQVMLFVTQTWLDHPSLQRFAQATMYIALPQGLPLAPESVPDNAFHALPLEHLDWNK